MPVSLRPRTPGSRRHPLIPDPSSSNSSSSSRKCDKVATNADRVPQLTPLAVMASTWPSSSYTAMDRDATREGGPSALSNTKSQTHTTEVYMASSSVSTYCHAANSTPSCLVASSRRLTNWARPSGGPRSRS
jgi:hypothetical protein